MILPLALPPIRQTAHVLLDMRDSNRRSLTSSLSRTAILVLLPAVLFSTPLTTDTPSDFSGVWSEINSASGRPMRLQLIQSGSKVQVRISYRETFPSFVEAVGVVEDGKVTWTARQSCTGRFQWPGYHYDNPGVNRYSLSLQDPSPGQTGRLLVYVQETQWHVPCATNHPVGTERIKKILRQE